MKVGIGCEARGFGGRHGSALQIQAASRRSGKPTCIVWILQAEVAFGGHVLSNGFEDGLRKVWGEQRSAQFLMSGVDSELCNLFPEIMQEMTIIVQQACEHNLVGFTGLLSKLCRLQSVLKFSDIFSVVAITTFTKDKKDSLRDIVGG